MQNLIRLALLSVLAGALLIATGCQKSEEVVVEGEGEVVVEESVAPVAEAPVAPLGEVSVEVETEAEGEAAAQ